MTGVRCSVDKYKVIGYRTPETENRKRGGRHVPLVRLHPRRGIGRAAGPADRGRRCVRRSRLAEDSKRDNLDERFLADAAAALFADAAAVRSPNSAAASPWIVGFLTPLFSLMIACTMAVAAFMVHIPQGQPFVDPKGGPSFELAAAYFAVAICLLLVGPGQFSLDCCIFGRRASSKGLPPYAAR